MDIRQLKYFLTIAEEGQITAAANRLNISQPPLSQQLKLLENELGVQLFIRNSRNVELTEAGILLRHKAEQLLDLFDSTINELKDVHSGTQGTLKIGTVGSSGITFLPQKVSEFHQIYPHVTFQVYEGDSFRIMELLNNGVIDLGFIREPFNTGQFNSIYVGAASSDQEIINEYEDYFVAIGKEELYDNIEDTISLSQLRDKPLIIHRRFDRIIREECEKKGFVPRIICSNNDVMSSLSWARVGIGLAILPFTSSNVITNLNLITKRIISPLISTKTALIWSKDKYSSTLAQNFIDLFQQEQKKIVAIL